MKPSENCFSLIKSQEGCVLHPYLDQADVPTIGWGTTIYTNGTHVTMSDFPLSQSQADDYLERDVQIVSNSVNAMVKVVLNQNQFDAIVDFAYNEGTGALHGSTALRLINVNPNDPGIRTALGLWDKLHKDGVLVFSQDLANRRKKEADLYFS